MTCAYIQHMVKSNPFFALLKNQILFDKAGRQYLPTPPPLFKKYPPSVEKRSLPTLLPYLMLILINPVYLLLTDKTKQVS